VNGGYALLPEEQPKIRGGAIRYFRRRRRFFAVRPAPILPSRLALGATPSVLTDYLLG
jgi:hypothetical protein